MVAPSPTPIGIKITPELVAELPMTPWAKTGIYNRAEHSHGGQECRDNGNGKNPALKQVKRYYRLRGFPFSKSKGDKSGRGYAEKHDYLP